MFNYIKNLSMSAISKIKAVRRSDLDSYYLREIVRSGVIRKEKTALVLRHLNNKIDLNTKGKALTVSEKKDLGINTRLKITRELLSIFNDSGRTFSNPKEVLSSIGMRAGFARSRDQSIASLQTANIKNYEVVGCRDERSCAWCKSMEGKQLPVTQSINRLIEANCTCESHCRLVAAAVIA